MQTQDTLPKPMIMLAEHLCCSKWQGGAMKENGHGDNSLCSIEHTQTECILSAKSALKMKSFLCAPEHCPHFTIGL